MKLNPTAIPQGTRTFLFEEAAQRRALEKAVHGILRGRGFEEIDTPLLDYYESAAVGLSEDERNRIIRFSEAESGRPIALRNDITMQIARSAATHLGGRPLPMRLFYSGPVFRHARKGKGEQYVIHQAGLEIVGHAGPEADIEIILSVKAALEKAFPRGYALSLGHAGIINSFLRPVPAAHLDAIKTALAKKDRQGLNTELEAAGVRGQQAERIIALTRLFGGKEVIGAARAIAAGDADALTALDNLSAIYDALATNGFGEKLSIDLGEMRGFGYYTGVIMELFSATGAPIGNGGRYDNLVKRFGPDLPAVGFAFDIDTMVDTLMRNGGNTLWKGADYLLLDAGNNAAADALRTKGFSVIVPLASLGLKDGLAFAQKMNIAEILVPAAGNGFKIITAATGVEAGKLDI